MFISKKKYENDLHEAKVEVAEEWERKLSENEKRMWEEQEKYRIREDFSRRFDALEKRILTLEKGHNLVEDTPTCPLAITPRY